MQSVVSILYLKVQDKEFQFRYSVKSVNCINCNTKFSGHAGSVSILVDWIGWCMDCIGIMVYTIVSSPDCTSTTQRVCCTCTYMYRAMYQCFTVWSSSWNL